MQPQPNPTNYKVGKPHTTPHRVKGKCFIFGFWGIAPALAPVIRSRKSKNIPFRITGRGFFVLDFFGGAGHP